MLRNLRTFNQLFYINKMLPTPQNCRIYKPAYTRSQFHLKVENGTNDDIMLLTIVFLVQMIIFVHTVRARFRLIVPVFSFYSIYAQLPAHGPPRSNPAQPRRSQTVNPKPSTQTTQTTSTSTQRSQTITQPPANKRKQPATGGGGGAKPKKATKPARDVFGLDAYHRQMREHHNEQGNRLFGQYTGHLTNRRDT